MQKEVKGYWGPDIHRSDASSGSEMKEEEHLVMGWIHYWKAYDMVPHSWVIESLTMMGIAKNVNF